MQVGLWSVRWSLQGKVVAHHCWACPGATQQAEGSGIKVSPFCLGWMAEASRLGLQGTGDLIFNFEQLKKTLNFYKISPTWASINLIKVLLGGRGGCSFILKL